MKPAEIEKNHYSFNLDCNRKMKNNYQDQIYIPSDDGYVVIDTNEIRERQKPSRPPAKSKIDWSLYKIKNNLQFGLMLLSMLAVVMYIGYTIGGKLGVLVTLATVGIGFTVRSNFKIEQILSKKKVRLVRPFEGPVLHQMVAKLIDKAGLEKMPYLFLDYTPEINAYTVEDNENSAIVVSRGLMENLNEREVYGVLAHEVAHLKNKDVRIMLFTDQIRSLTGYMAFFGQILLFFSIPFLIVNQIVLPWLAILLLIFSPTISFLFHVALSRNREFRADLDAIALTGDSTGLATALKKINTQMSLWQRLYSSYLRKVPEILRTHPNTKSRIARLESLTAPGNQQISWSYKS